MKVVEKFISINGEGPKAGELAVFIRFKGCNLKCHYCDTTWANEEDCVYEEQSPEQIVSYVEENKIKNVTLTGGEPLLQVDMDKLLQLLGKKENIYVEIETNGSVPIKKFTNEYRPSFTMDYKLSASGYEDKMHLDNFNYLQKEDTVKFVVGSILDLDKASEIIQTYSLIGKCHIYLSPVFGMIEPKEIVEYMIEHNMNDVRMQLQMHKFIWNPAARGV